MRAPRCSTARRASCRIEVDLSVAERCRRCDHGGRAEGGRAGGLVPDRLRHQQSGQCLDAARRRRRPERDRGAAGAALGRASRAPSRRCGRRRHFINCCFADVVNPLIAALDLPITCGVGNVAILANAFSGALALGSRTAEGAGALSEPRAWRRAAETRGGPLGARLDRRRGGRRRLSALCRCPADPRARDRDLGRERRAADARHGAADATGAGTCPGRAACPAAIRSGSQAGEIDLDLPAALTRGEAIAWNLRYEQESGLVVGPDGRATYTGILRERLAAFSPDLAAGFHVARHRGRLSRHERRCGRGSNAARLS